MFRSVIFTLFFAASVNAFHVAPPAARKSIIQPLSMVGTHIDKNFAAGSGMNEHDIPLFIENLAEDNFEQSLEMLEALLTNECVGDVCDDYLGMLEDKAESIGKKIPEGYAPFHH